MREAVRLPRVLAEEHCNFGVFEVGWHESADHLAVDPGLSRLHLSERVRAVDDTECCLIGGTVATVEMVALSPTAVVENRCAAERVTNALEPGGDLGDGGVPIDRFIGAVWTATHRPQLHSQRMPALWCHRRLVRRRPVQDARYVPSCNGQHHESIS